MTGEILYTPNEKQTHRCITPDNTYTINGGYPYPKGTIWRCNECGKHWGIDGYSQWSRIFVGPFKRRFLRRAQAAQ